MLKTTSAAEVLKDIAIAAYKAKRANDADKGGSAGLISKLATELAKDPTLVADVEAAIPNLTSIPAEIKGLGLAGWLQLGTEIEALVASSIAEVNALPPLEPTPAPVVEAPPAS